MDVQHLTQSAESRQGDSRFGVVGQDGTGCRVEHPIRQSTVRSIGKDNQNAIWRNVSPAAHDPHLTLKEWVVAVADSCRGRRNMSSP